MSKSRVQDKEREIMKGTGQFQVFRTGIVLPHCPNGKTWSVPPIKFKAGYRTILESELTKDDYRTRNCRKTGVQDSGKLSFYKAI